MDTTEESGDREGASSAATAPEHAAAADDASPVSHAAPSSEECADPSPIAASSAFPPAAADDAAGGSPSGSPPSPPEEARQPLQDQQQRGASASPSSSPPSSSAAPAAPAAPPPAAPVPTVAQASEETPQLTAVPTAAAKKVKLHFRPVGSAPILKMLKFEVLSHLPFSQVTMFLRKKLREATGDKSLPTPFVFCNQAFCPSPDQNIGDLFLSFAVAKELQLHYSFQEAWG
jgi:hypothetical protein